MPELPDLAVYAENLMARLKGKMVQSVDYHRDARLNTSYEELRNLVCNTSIASVERSGKEIAFFFSNKATLFVHLMLYGKFTITPDPGSVRFRVLTIGFEDGLALVVSDQRLSDSQGEPHPEQRPRCAWRRRNVPPKENSGKTKGAGQGFFNGSNDYPWHRERLCRRNTLAGKDFSEIYRWQNPRPCH
jgi:hypothetical protein